MLIIIFPSTLLRLRTFKFGLFSLTRGDSRYYQPFHAQYSFTEILAFIFRANHIFIILILNQSTQASHKASLSPTPATSKAREHKASLRWSIQWHRHIIPTLNTVHLRSNKHLTLKQLRVNPNLHLERGPRNLAPHLPAQLIDPFPVHTAIERFCQLQTADLLRDECSREESCRGRRSVSGAMGTDGHRPADAEEDGQGVLRRRDGGDVLSLIWGEVLRGGCV